MDRYSSKIFMTARIPMASKTQADIPANSVAVVLLNIRSRYLEEVQLTPSGLFG